MFTQVPTFVLECFGPNSHPFYDQLFGNDPAVTVANTEAEKIGRLRRPLPRDWASWFLLPNTSRLNLSLKKKQMNWWSVEQLNPEGVTPQGDPRAFIYLAGQELAQRFGFEFRVEGDDVILRVPDADRIAKTVEKLNRVLISRGQEPISYLPIRSGFNKLGETLALAEVTDGVIELRFSLRRQRPKNCGP